MIITDIEFGSVRYFTLLKFQTILKARDFERLELPSFDKLKYEVDMLVNQVHTNHNNKKK